MKKILLILLPVLFITGMAVYQIANATAQTKIGGLMDKKILVAYFSWGGNTNIFLRSVVIGGERAFVTVLLRLVADLTYSFLYDKLL